MNGQCVKPGCARDDGSRGFFGLFMNVGCVCCWGLSSQVVIVDGRCFFWNYVVVEDQSFKINGYLVILYEN